MAQHRHGPDPPGAEQPGQSDLDGQQGRLGHRRTGELSRRLGLAARRWIEDLTQVEPQAPLEVGGGAIDLNSSRSNSNY